jgi:hypothetical protein
MCSVKRSPGIPRTLVLLACMAGVLGFSIPGCSFGVGNAAVSPETQTKAKENFKKRFDNFGEKKKVRRTSR